MLVPDSSDKTMALCSLLSSFNCLYRLVVSLSLLFPQLNSPALSASCMSDVPIPVVFNTFYWTCSSMPTCLFYWTGHNSPGVSYQFSVERGSMTSSICWKHFLLLLKYLQKPFMLPFTSLTCFKFRCVLAFLTSSLRQWLCVSSVSVYQVSPNCLSHAIVCDMAQSQMHQATSTVNAFYYRKGKAEVGSGCILLKPVKKSLSWPAPLIRQHIIQTSKGRGKEHMEVTFH